MSLLTKPAKDLLEKKVLDKKWHKKIGMQLLSKWNIPLNISNDLFTLRRDVSTESDYILYHLLFEADKNLIPKGYPPKHLEKQLNQKYNDEKIEFPLEFDMIQISYDQWIGKISARELFKLGNSMLINYNENAQRVMKKITSPNGDYYVIKLNERAVESIQDLFKSGRYISNTITLNIPVDNNSVFNYDEHTGKMIIKSINMFDILDGYHRYVAISRICAFDYDFDQMIELRITNFDDDRARQFIWQEDQKTKMSKIDSDSFNVYDDANSIVKRIQSNGIYGKLIAPNGCISNSLLSRAISTIFLNHSKKSNTSINAKIGKRIIDGFGIIQENDEEIFDKPLDYIHIYCMIYVIKNEAYNHYTDLCEFAQENQLFKGKEIKAKDINQLDDFVKGGV